MKITLEGNPEEIAAYEMALKDGKSEETKSANYVGKQEVTDFHIGEDAIQSIKKSILDDITNHHHNV